MNDIAVGTFAKRSEAIDCLEQWKSKDDVASELWSRYQTKATKVIPNFSSRFIKKSTVYSMKTKFKNKRDSRYVRVSEIDNVITVQSGKIDTVFDAYALVRRKMGV